MKKGVIVFASVLAGNWAAEKFLLKATPEDTSGFIQVADGPGWDDVARAASVLLMVFIGDKIASAF